MDRFREIKLAIGSCCLGGILSACGATKLPWVSNVPQNCIEIAELALKKSHEDAISNQGRYVKHIILATEQAGYTNGRGWLRVPLMRAYVYSINDDGRLENGWWSQLVQGFPYPFMRDNTIEVDEPPSPEPIMKSSEGFVCMAKGIIVSNTFESNKIRDYDLNPRRITWNANGGVDIGF